MTDDRERMKTLLGGVVAAAPEPPTVEEIAVRIDEGPVVTLGGEDREPSSGRSVARASLVAALVLAVVAIGVFVVGSRDEAPDNVVAEQPDDSALVSGDQALAMVPTELPEGLAPVWVSSGVSDEGRFAAVHYSPQVGDDGLPVGWRLKVESVQVDPDEVDLVADARESGSLELWDGREVVVTDDGGTAQFVDPAGLQVLVRGDADVVRTVVPTLEVLGESDWDAFLDDLSSGVGALPMVAAFDLIPNDGAEGFLTSSEVTTGPETVRITVHGDPQAMDGGGGGGTGVAAGTCLTVDDVTACRPGQFLTFGVPGGMQSSFDVLIDGDWWHFGWSTTELTGVTVTPDQGVDGGSGVRWAFEGAGHGTSMSWYASVLPAEATQIQVELQSEVISGFPLLRPAH